MDAQNRLAQAMEAVIKYSMENEEHHFMENLTEEETRDKTAFIAKLKAHICYRYLEMLCEGNADKIEEMEEHYWFLWGAEEEEEE